MTQIIIYSLPIVVQCMLIFGDWRLAWVLLLMDSANVSLRTIWSLCTCAQHCPFCASLFASKLQEAEMTIWTNQFGQILLSEKFCFSQTVNNRDDVAEGLNSGLSCVCFPQFSDDCEKLQFWHTDKNVRQTVEPRVKQNQIEMKGTIAVRTFMRSQSRDF